MTTPLDPAPVTFVHTKVTLYHSNLVDLRVSRTVHSTDACAASQGTSLTGNTCGAVHYGRCTPVSLVTNNNNNALGAPTAARSNTMATTPHKISLTPSDPYQHRNQLHSNQTSVNIPRTMVNMVHIETQPRDTQTVTLNSPVTMGIPPRGYSPITIETTPSPNRKSPSPTRTITFETHPAGRASPRQVTIETYPAASISPRSVAMEMFPRRGSPIRSLSPRSFVIETYPPNATRPKTFTIETRPVDVMVGSRHVTMSTRTIPIEIRPTVNNKPLPSSPGTTTTRHIATNSIQTNSITIPVTKSRVVRVPGIPTGQSPHPMGGGVHTPFPRRPLSLDGLVSMVNGNHSDLESTDTTAGGGSGGAGIASRAMPAPVTSIPKLPSSARASHQTGNTVSGTGNRTVSHNVVRTQYNLNRSPNYIRIAEVVRAMEEEGADSVTPPAVGNGTGMALEPGRAVGLNPGLNPAPPGRIEPPIPVVPGDDDPSSPGSPTLHVLRQVARDDVAPKPGGVSRGEPDGQADSFLRQKEAQLREKREREKLEKKVGAGDGEKTGVQNRTNKAEIVNDTSHLGNLVNNRLDKGDNKYAKRKEPSPMDTGYQGYIQDKSLATPQQPVVNKSKSETVHTVEQINTQQQSLPGQRHKQQQQQQQPNRTSGGVSNNRELIQQQQQIQPQEQQTKSLLSDKKQSQNVVAKERPGSANKKPVAKPVVKDLSAHIPQFYFPMGQPMTSHAESDAILQRIKEAFGAVEGGKASRIQMGAVAKACGFPTFWKGALHHAAASDKSGYVTLQSYLALWRKLVANCHDDATRFIRLLAKPGCHHLVAEDFIPLIQDVVDTHPGLTFLQDAPEFHSRYVHTVISRIFYTINRSWSGKINVLELRRSNFLQTLALLDDEDDINQVVDFFSYEHFYVIYCKFWELDKDHDLFISKDDLAKHNDHAISTKMIERIFSGSVTRGRAQKEGKMSYTEFVWFLMSEEDKRNPTSIEYWFRCMDLDGDGVISMYEMEFFYEEMVQRMEALGIETLPFEDCLCQMLDMVKPSAEGRITLSDLKACKMTPLYFDTFFNLEKYLEHEQKDPFANVKDPDEPEMTDWERYAAEEYEILVAEEGANEMNGDDISYEDDFEPDDESPVPTPKSEEREGERVIEQRPGGGVAGKKGNSQAGEDIYDFTPSDLGY